MTQGEAWRNQLYYGDNLEIMRQFIAESSVDLIYLDPPFNSKATYNVLFGEANGTASAAQIAAFEDTWHWDIGAEMTYAELVRGGPAKLADLMQALRKFLGENDMMAYLVMMAIRLVEMRQVLKPTGSIYLHCDPTASHYIKLLMDSLFGPGNFRNEIIWQRTSAHSGTKRWGPVHDVILFYSKTSAFAWNPIVQRYSAEYVDRFYRFSDDRDRFRIGDLTGAGTRKGESGRPWRAVDPTEAGRHWAVPNKILTRTFGDRVATWTVQEKLDALDQQGLVYWPPKGKVPGFKRYLDPTAGVPIVDVVTDIKPIAAHAAERLGYPTQKPEALLERIISASSRPGDLVLDPFCGCGTTITVAERLDRRWIGIDITHLAIALIINRLHDTFGSKLSPFDVIGDPKDLSGARDLAARDAYQFQWWALGKVGARPAQDRKKGADRGIDGWINFFDDNSGQAKRIVVQVKSGQVKSGDIRDLKGVMAREKAEIGAFITLEPPTSAMRTEAAAAGFYKPAAFPGQQYPALQVLTVEDILAGAQVQYPRTLDAWGKQAPGTFKRAKRQGKGPKQEQGRIL